MKRTFRILTTVQILLFLPVNLPAQFSATDLVSYLQQAQTANPGLKAFEQHYEAARHRIPLTSSFPDPMLQVVHFVESVQTRTGPQENAFMLSQRLPWFGKLSSRGDMASAQAEALWYAFQNQQLMVAREVALAYFEYGYTGKAIEIASRNLELLKSLEPIVETRVTAGGDLNPLLRLQVEIGKVSDRLQSLRNKRTIESAALGSLLALPADTILPWPDWQAPPIDDLNFEALALAIEENNPELAMMERQITSAEARQEIARLEYYPDITLGVNYIQIGTPATGAMSPDAGKDPWSVSISVNLPLWFEKNQAGRSEALSSRRAAELEYENRRNSLKSQMSASIARLNDAQRQLSLYGEELLDLAQQATDITLESYKSGRASILEVIDSEQSLLELQLLYWRAAGEAWQQRVTIQALANQPLAGNFKATSDK